MATEHTFAVIVSGRFSGSIAKLRAKLSQTSSRPVFCIVAFRMSLDESFAVGADIAIVETNQKLAKRKQHILQVNPSDSWMWTVVVEDIKAIFVSTAQLPVSNDRDSEVEVTTNWAASMDAAIAMSARQIANKQAYIIDDVFSARECETLIDCAETIGFGGTSYEKEYRGNLRLIITDVKFTDVVRRRLEPWVPKTMTQSHDEWDFCGLNERWRLAKYYPGDRFQKHCDVAYQRSQDEMSMFTVNIYMNSDFKGGKTRFYFGTQTNIDHEVSPKPGMCLLFRQPPGESYLHDGEEVTGGIKYLFRTDVMYRRRGNCIPSITQSRKQRICNDRTHETTVTTDWAASLRGTPLLSAKQIKNKHAFLVENVFTADECETLIDSAETVGFGGTNYKKDYRGNLRLVIMDTKLADAVKLRLKPWVPQTVTLDREIWDFCGLNESWRLAKYYPGDKFQKHCDAVFRRSQNEMSIFTVNIYMNADFKGGKTRFYFGGQSEADYAVEPKPGLCLLFQQPPGESYLHDGEEVTGGIKYLFRSDLMYRRRVRSRA